MRSGSRRASGALKRIVGAGCPSRNRRVAGPFRRWYASGSTYNCRGWDSGRGIGSELGARRMSLERRWSYSVGGVGWVRRVKERRGFDAYDLGDFPAPAGSRISTTRRAVPVTSLAGPLPETTQRRNHRRHAQAHPRINPRPSSRQPSPSGTSSRDRDIMRTP